ncbi:aspartate carbamoyltransferase catalytic subunit [Oceanobacillus iheyensis]|uniref:Aspartate carbamoyltransferase catalytic subunit n=1 Tax=Oceanobacillus iheyensis (strain DSM 14371 / CIP 107618 / JCM 11309 / KCTC 3954 / HTE831) TaxID=221109 RepID=PYRB_OCEIH|nr:aspartate carbamoyltransferase catalytic subunit [Oceanobacillus iheyensis]Q8ER38.1 RecName: Full=Aspartate carbamoyltransferase catalytic subunit; AltName: Full=Aspartate transcarbamylase; Short=ATCase [Oceanobacillus iheyensis HTE831]BAC13444.1 aspartate carbamoyltransferase catalytic chain [Oceanobacillus iheyensis HTE831]
MRHFISVNQLEADEMYQIIRKANELRDRPNQLNRQLFAGNLFFEPSTRTKMSFSVAERKLGVEILDFHTEASSLAKGESLYDTAKTFEAIGANFLVIRHPSDQWISELEQGGKLNIPVINAGSGKEEHPTQCLLDLLTMYQEFGSIKGLKVVIAGDIKHSRVAKSNAMALTKLGAKVIFSAAPGFEDHTLDYPYLTMDEAIEEADVLMLLRIQHERHLHKAETSDYLSLYGLTKERYKKLQDHAILMHPAPINRGVEIDTNLVESEKSRIFKQMSNGVYVRMAIIMHVLSEWGIIHENNLIKRKSLTAI